VEVEEPTHGFQNQPRFQTVSSRQTNLQQVRNPCHISKQPFQVPVIPPGCKCVFYFSEDELRVSSPLSNSLLLTGMAWDDVLGVGERLFIAAGRYPSI